MRVLITGGSGFLGSALARQLAGDGHELVILSRNPNRHSSKLTFAADWVKRLEDIQSPVDAVVNLAGANLFTLPWSRRRKDTLWRSRIETTERLVQWMQQQEQPPQALLSGSAVGFYGDQGDSLLTEVSPYGNGWSTEMVVAWENAASTAERAGIRTVYLRTGLVLGNGGFMQPLLPTFKLGLGGSLADGQFWFSWIHLQDWVNAVCFLLQTPTLNGPVNLTAPEPVRYQEFARTLGEVLHRPVWLTPPRWVLKPALGERSELMLSSTRAVPQQLQDAGYSWQYATLKPALEAVCR